MNHIYNLRLRFWLVIAIAPPFPFPGKKILFYINSSKRKMSALKIFIYIPHLNSGQRIIAHKKLAKKRSSIYTLVRC